MHNFMVFFSTKKGFLVKSDFQFNACQILRFRKPDFSEVVCTRSQRPEVHFDKLLDGKNLVNLVRLL